jgi:hypothetical protein
MNLSIYQKAVEETPIGKLTAFLKDVEDIVEIEGWAKLRAPEKRAQIMEALGQSKELRKEFVAWFATETGKDSDFSEWETAALPPVDGAPAPAVETPVDEADEPATPEPAPTPEPATEPDNHDIPQEVATPEPAPTPVPVKGKGKSATKAVSTTLSSVFVEGAFEQIVADVAGLDAQQSKINLVEAEDRLEFEHVRIGALLSHIQKSQHYTTLGYDNLREFLAAETGLQYRKAAYLISNYDAVRELGIPAADLKGVTWSALRHIIPILTTKNYKEWLEAARSQTHASLITQVAIERAKQAGALPAPAAGEAGGTSAPGAAELAKAITKTFQVFPDQNEVINAALEKAKATGNVDSNAAALDIIAAAYTGAPPASSTVAAVMPDLSPDGLRKMFSRLRAEGGTEAVVPVLEIIGEIWPEVDITAAFPEAASAA